ncbi:MAG: CARDB domain-containing protein [Planctomycetota bacterium]
MAASDARPESIMSQPKSRRRVLLPVLLATATVSTSAGVWYAAQRGKADTQDTPVAASGPIEAPSATMDAVLRSWGGDATTPPSAPAVTQAVYEAPVGDRYAATKAGPIAPASISPPPADAPMARGQSPDRPVASIEPTQGNPLRSSSTDSSGRYRQLDASEARRAFGEVLAAGAANAVAPPAVETYAEAVPAAYESDEAADAFAQPAPLPIGPLPAGPPAPVADQAASPPPFPPQPFNPPAPGGDGDAAPPEFAPLPIPEPVARQGLPRTSEAPTAGFDAFPPVGANELRSAASTYEPGPLPTGAPEPIGQPATAAANDAGFTPLPGAGRPGDRSMEGRQQPSIAIQKFAPGEVQVGKAARFVTKVRNVGQRPVVGVIVRDQTPAGARLMNTTPRAATDGGQITWDLGTLSPGEERTLEMELTPIEEGEIGSVATVSFAAQASAKSRCTRPKLAIRMTAPSQVLVGRQQRVKIEIRNPGTGAATGVVLLENVPENLRHEAGAALEFEVGSLAAGETKTLELVMQAEKAGHVVNTLTARADGNLEVQQSVEFDVVAPRLAVAVAGPKRRYLERPATYTVSINNPGTASAKDVRLVTRLPQGMRFVKANNLGEYDSSTHSVYWSLAELPEGEHGEVKLTALPVTSGDLTIQVEGQASEGLKDETALAVKIEGIASLNFEVLDVEDPIEVGGETVYEVRVTNQGTKAATNVGVRVVTPPGLEAVAASGESRHSVQGSAVVFAPLDRLAPQADSLFRVRVKGVQAGDQRLTVELSSDDLSQPVRKEESTRVFGDE